MTSSVLIQRLEDGVLELVLDRPSRKNALNRELVLALGDALERAAVQTDVRVVLLSGAGGSFCSGADLRDLDAVEPAELEVRLDEFHRLIRGIARLPQPVVALVEGPAVGFGADLALACDLRWFSEDAYLEESFVKIGLMPDGGGTLWVQRFVGPGKAFELLALGARLSARESERLGIASRVVPSAELEARGRELARRLADTAPLALRAIKRSLRAVTEAELEATLAREKAGQLELLRSRDFAEGVRAFLEKRPPQFQGR